jgi:hypothetical protein
VAADTGSDGEGIDSGDQSLELLSWQEMATLSGPWAYFVACSERDMDNHAYWQSSTVSSVLVRVVRGRRCGSPEQLFQEWAAALQFPYYFGHNWDALHECIRDLEWLPANGYIIVATHIEDVLTDYADDFEYFIDYLRDTAQDWASRKIPAPFRVVFHCRASNEHRAWLRLEHSGIAVEKRRVRNFGRTSELET